MMSPNTHNPTHPAHHPTASLLQPHAHIHGRAPAANIDAKQRLEASNIAHFDALSVDYDRRHPGARKLALRLAHALRRVLPFDEDTTSVLDYACGSGTVPVPILLLPGKMVYDL